MRIYYTQKHLESGKIKGEEAAINTHQEVGANIRAAVESMGEMLPEDMPTEPSIKPLLDEKKRKKKKLLTTNPEQGSLF